MNELSDDEFAELLGAAQRGEGPGYDGLVRLVDRRILGFSRARGADDPEGITNDVLVKMCQSIGTFSGNQTQFRSWVFTIARRRLIDEHRRAGRRVDARPVAPTELPELSVDLLPSGVDQRERIYALLADLTDDQREVLLLRVVAGLSVQETAAATGRRPGAVRAMQHRAIKDLRARTAAGA